MMCEKCWSDAYARMLADLSRNQSDHYMMILIERKEAGKTCTPREQAGEWWDEERQCDSRTVKATAAK